MAHYAFLDANNVVVKVIVGINENETQVDNGTPVGGSTEAWEQFYENQPWHSGLTCKRTSYNGNIRGRYAGIGYTYDAVNNVFIRPQPYASWTLGDNFDWQPPTPRPDNLLAWFWNETNLMWEH